MAARRAARIAGTVGLQLALGCGKPASPAADADPPPGSAPASAAADGRTWSGVPWPPPLARREAIAAELARDATALPMDHASPTDDDTWRSYARIGPRDAAEIVLQQLAIAAPSPGVLAAIGLLEPPASGAGEAVEPTGAWVILERDLWTRFAVTEDHHGRAALGFAIGRIGGRTSQTLWATALGAGGSADTDDDRVAAFDAIAIACARRHPLHTDTVVVLGAAIDGGAPAVREAALGALGRCIVPSAERFAAREPWVTRLSVAVAGDDDEVARLGWRALGALGELPQSVPPAVLGDPAAPWLVEVEAVRALAAHVDGRAVLVARLVALTPESITGTRAVVVWTALQSMRRAIDAEPESFTALAGMREAISAATPQGDRHATELGVVRCELALLAAVAGAPVGDVERCNEGVAALPESYGEALAIEAWVATTRADSRPSRADALVERARDHRPALAAAALSALADLDDPRVSAVLRDALVRADPGVLAAAAGAIAARAVDRDRRDPAAAAALEGLLRTADPASAIEARIAAIEALGALARGANAQVQVVDRGDGSSSPGLASARDEARTWLSRTVVPLGADPSDAVRRAAWAALAGFDDLRAQLEPMTPAPGIAPFDARLGLGLDAFVAEGVTGLRLHTAAGAIVIDFAGMPAPIAQANLVALAREGYFDGLRFHRVVPGFVAQGGDPRGDGYGGPGWLLPCEWSDVRYERGTVGMALAGKDTGGSQFFIAQTRQPHLDGRFAVIGQVTEGLDVVDRLLPQDTIVRVEVIAPRQAQ